MPVPVDPDVWLNSRDLTDTLIVAPAGCGKTEMLSRRAEYCVTAHLLPDHARILALTFTRKARKNLAARLHDRVGERYRQHVSVTTFHGFAYRVFQNYHYVLGRDLPQFGPLAGRLTQLRNEVAKVHDVAPQRIDEIIRAAKDGGYGDDEVIDRIEHTGSAAAMDFELRLRAEDRFDYHDVMRLGVMTLSQPDVGRLYSLAFPYVGVDEAQDLTRLQYQLVAALTMSSFVFAGDLAQGIFTWAGADGDWVFDAFSARAPTIVELRGSYRSSPAVLKTVSALAVELGGYELTSAQPEKWAGRGVVSIEHFPHPTDEASWILDVVEAWLRSDPSTTIGVIARLKQRYRWVRAEAERRGIPVEDWDSPIHGPEVIQLLQKYAPAVSRAMTVPERLEELYLLCRSELNDDDLDGADQLDQAIEQLRELCALEDLDVVLGRFRVLAAEDQPAGPGLHLVSCHSGKGQQFDRVIVVGLEEGLLPSWPASREQDDHDDIRAELATLHVAASRAREDLVFTVSEDVPKPGSERMWQRSPSRFLGLLEQSLPD